MISSETWNRELFWVRFNYFALGGLLLGEILSSISLFFESPFAIWGIGFSFFIFCIIGMILVRFACFSTLPYPLKNHYNWQKKTIVWHFIWLVLQISIGIFFIWQMMHYFIAGITYFFTQLFLFVFTLGLKRPAPIETFYSQPSEIDLFFLHHFELCLIISLIFFPLWVSVTQGWFLYRIIKGVRQFAIEVS